MARTIQHKRGLEKNLPTLKPGELALTTDTKKVFVGTDSGNVEVTGGTDAETKEKVEGLTAELAETGSIKGTTQKVTFNSRKLPEKIQHVDKQGSVLREDSFVYSGKLITETRTLKSGYSVTYKHDLKTLQTEVL